MNWNRTRLGVSLAVLIAGCSSSSTAPKPSLAGTWHVSVGTLNSGTLSPSSFDVTVTQTGGNYTVSMPTLTWSGGLVFDSGPNLEGFSPSDTIDAGFIAFTHAPHAHLCEFVMINGRKNQGLDTLKGGQIGLESADTIPGPYCPSPTVVGAATINK